MSRSASQFVVCVNNSEYPASLELRKLYQVIPDTAAAKLRMLRIVDESGEDYLYPAECFVAVALPPSTKKAVLQADNFATL